MLTFGASSFHRYSLVTCINSAHTHNYISVCEDFSQTRTNDSNMLTLKIPNPLADTEKAAFLQWASSLKGAVIFKFDICL